MHNAIFSITIVVACAFTALLVSRRVHNTIITMPMIYVALGVAVGPALFDVVHIERGSEVARIIAELTLVLVLASDASRIRMRSLRQFHDIPIRLLSIGLPLMIVL